MAVRSSCAILFILLSTAPSLAQIDFDREPISYNSAPHHDRVARLIDKLKQGQTSLPFDERFGYLKSVLRELSVSEKSQTLVFSKTSFQRTRISPKRPRAIYFNDDTYVGWVQEGEVIELSSIDSRLGAIFYTLEQKNTRPPTFVRQTDDCLQCHASSMTQNIPGHLVRSVYPGGTGNPISSAGSFRTTYQSPLAERWGGWYVTGTHGRERHMGNAVLRGTAPEDLDRDAGANVTDLQTRFNVRSYLTPHSDIVALMVLEHQVPMHNVLTAANYQAILARQEQEELNRMSGKPLSDPIENIERRYQWAGDKVIECLLFVGEAKLSDEIGGTSGFAEFFAGSGPRDKQGRSLREVDLRRRLFKYPCSYLIYSEAFTNLAAPVKTHVYRRLWNILTSQESPPEYAHLDPAGRRAIYQILKDTKADLPDYWRSREP